MRTALDGEGEGRGDCVVCKVRSSTQTKKSERAWVTDKGKKRSV